MSDRDFHVAWTTALQSETEQEFLIGCRDLVTIDEVYLQKIWRVAKMPLIGIIRQNNMDVYGFAVRFCIPFSTVYDMCNTGCPDYMRLGFARQLGMV